MDANSHRRRLLLLAASIPAVLAGCAVPTGAQVTALPALAAGSSEIIVYRPIDAAQRYYELQLDGAGTGDLMKNGGVLVRKVPPGRRSIGIRMASLFPSSSVDANTLVLEVKPNERRFVRLRLRSGEQTTYGMGMVGRYTYAVEEVSATEGAAEVRGLRYLQ
jgi:hypothetical protein